MADESIASNQLEDLRRRAEELLRAAPQQFGQVPPVDVQQLIHELRVYQTELEMQNEELRRAQDELSASRDLYFGLYDLAPVGYLTVTTKGLIVRANLTFATLLGLNRQDLVAQPLSRFVLPDDQGTFYRHFGQLREVYDTQACDLRMVKQDGASFHAHLECRIDPGSEGEGRLLVTAIDLSERVHVEESIRRSEAEKALILNSTSELFAYYDLDLRLLWANAASARSLGRRMDELVGSHYYEIWYNGHEPCADCPVRHCRQTRQPQEAELPTADGRVYQVRAYPVSDNSGTLQGFAELRADITLRRQAEDALRESEAQYRTLFDDVPIGLYRTDPDGNILDANPALVAMLGYPDLATLREVKLADLVVDAEDRIRELHALEREGTVRHFEIRLRRRDGTIIHVHDNSRAIRGDDGTVSNYEGSLEDITSHKSLEEQYRQAQKMETIGQLAGGMAHDFNNLLTAIIGNASLAEEALPRENPVQEDLAEIRASANRAARLTRQLLAFSRRQILSPQVIDLNELIASMDGLLRRLIREDIELVTAGAPELGLVLADPSQIEQVIVNLVVNARDAMPQGGTLTIETGNVSADVAHDDAISNTVLGDQVLLQVIDTGIGMPAEVRQHLFEPFFTTKGPGRGTGLGLATAYGIVKQHQGEILVRSEPGRGSTFTIYLPRVQSESRASISPDRALESLVGGTETILLVEDDPAVRRVSARVLSRIGYRLLEAEDGQDALRVVREHAGDIDLLLTDLIMPRMGGRALAETLREERPDLKVLLISGHTDDDIVQDIVLDGAMSFLQKPFDRVTLARRIRDILDGAPAP